MEWEDEALVLSARIHGETGAIVELLAIAFEPGEAPGGTVMLTFAGGGDLRVGVDCLDVVLADVSEPWATPRRPGHAD